MTSKTTDFGLITEALALLRENHPLTGDPKDRVIEILQTMGSGSHADADINDVVWRTWVIGFQTLCSNLRFRHERKMWDCLRTTIDQCEEHYQTLLKLKPPRDMECNPVALEDAERVIWQVRHIASRRHNYGDSGTVNRIMRVVDKYVEASGYGKGGG